MASTRRSILAAVSLAPAGALVARPAAALAPPMSLAAQLARADAYAAQVNARAYPHTEAGQAALLADTQLHTAMERVILSAPIRSGSDAAVKLRCAARNIEEGGMTCGSDARALEQVARWAEAL